MSSRGHRIRFIEKRDRLSLTSVWAGDLLPAGTAARGRSLTGLADVDPAPWLVWYERRALFAQTLLQEDSFAITLLVAKRTEDAVERTRDPAQFRP